MIVKHQTFPINELFSESDIADFNQSKKVGIGRSGYGKGAFWTYKYYYLSDFTDSEIIEYCKRVFTVPCSIEIGRDEHGTWKVIVRRVIFPS